jgi:lipopolysaccharide export system protein LptC
MTLRLLALVALIGAAVAITDWLQDLQQDLQRAPAETSASAPDFIFRYVDLTVMGVEGAPRYRIEAPRMVHYAPGDSAQITSPRFWFYRDDGPAIELRSERAKVAAAGERVWLLGAVNILRPPHAGLAPLTVRTRDVTVFPDTERARTKAPVVASGGAQRLAGVGMVLDLAAGTLNLLSQVRGTYVP